MPRFNLDEYVDVQTRIRQFWNDYPEGRIITSLMSLPDDFTVCRYRAEVFVNQHDTRPAATGWAVEHAGGQGANQTSHEENCETSAIGRALANLGYATSQRDRPSREEMAKVERATDIRPHEPAVPAAARQEQGEPPNANLATPKQITVISVLMEKSGLTVEDARAVMKERYGKVSRQVLTRGEASDFITWLEQHQPAEQAALTPA